MDEMTGQPTIGLTARLTAGLRIMQNNNLPSRKVDGIGREEALPGVEEDAVEMSPAVLDALGNALRAHYRAIAEVPLPDRIMSLLAELEAKELGNDR